MPALFGGARRRGVLLRGDELFRLERGHAAETRGRDRLPENLVLDVAGGENPGDRRRRRNRHSVRI